ncbi:MAG: hypothetical protein KBB37_06725 [Bacteroidia bacterium]|nr:hypothetical protein [Bacteroidia bacterium]MBP7260961.1 hypothetical protein [Bacteroidia bacterium]MBP9180440.1 hypothetical protein [Bacteroidia bacterium]MBP9723587.1 hypothetical protein [Bacteroidia bacterium]
MRSHFFIALSLVSWLTVSCKKDTGSTNNSTLPPDSLTVQIDVPACGNTPCAPTAHVDVREYYSGTLLHTEPNAKTFGYSHRFTVKNGFRLRLFAPNGEATLRLLSPDFTRPDSVRYQSVAYERAGYDTTYQTFDYVYYIRQ